MPKILIYTASEGAAPCLQRLLDYPVPDGWTVSASSLPHLGQDFEEADLLIFVMAAGIVLRKLAPLIQTKDRDPAVLLIDQAATTVVPLLSGHLGGANDWALKLAAYLEARALLTTATDQAGLTAIDSWAHKLGAFLTPTKGILAISRQQLKSGKVLLYSDRVREPLPEGYELKMTEPGHLPGPISEAWVWLSERPWPEEADVQPTLWLCPRTLVLGLGCRRGIETQALQTRAEAWLRKAGFAIEALGALASHEIKADEAAIQALGAAWGLALRFYPAAPLARLCEQNPSWPRSSFVEAQVGTPAVAQAAAVLRAGGTLLKEERGEGLSLALARSSQSLVLPQEGEITVCGYGPGGLARMSREAYQALSEADLIVTYKTYAEELSTFFPQQRFLSTGMTQEIERCRLALTEAQKGQRVVLASNGDAGIYGMASLLLELRTRLGAEALPWRVIPGITAATAAAAAVGAPLSHDFCLISLSDRLTPWELIQKRLRLAAEADLVICLYNPRSKGRPHYLGLAIEEIRKQRGCPLQMAVVRHAGRAEESRWIGTDADFDPEWVDMHAVVLIGNSQSKIEGGLLLTPRGYEGKRQWNV